MKGKGRIRLFLAPLKTHKVRHRNVTCWEEGGLLGNRGQDRCVKSSFATEQTGADPPACSSLSQLLETSWFLLQTVASIGADDHRAQSPHRRQPGLLTASPAGAAAGRRLPRGSLALCATPCPGEALWRLPSNFPAAPPVVRPGTLPTPIPSSLRARPSSGGRGGEAVPPPGPALPGPAEAVGGPYGRGINRRPLPPVLLSSLDSGEETGPPAGAGRRLRRLFSRGAAPAGGGAGSCGARARRLRLPAAAASLSRTAAAGSGGLPPPCLPAGGGLRCSPAPHPCLCVRSGRRRGGAAPAVMRATGRRGVRFSR